MYFSLFFLPTYFKNRIRSLRLVSLCICFLTLEKEYIHRETKRRLQILFLVIVNSGKRIYNYLKLCKERKKCSEIFSIRILYNKHKRTGNVRIKWQISINLFKETVLTIVYVLIMRQFYLNLSIVHSSILIYWLYIIWSKTERYEIQ